MSGILNKHDKYAYSPKEKVYSPQKTSYAFYVFNFDKLFNV